MLAAPPTLKIMTDDPVKKTDQDEQELTFESGYGAQDKVLGEDESLEDVASVSEADVRQDLQRDSQEDWGEEEPDSEA